MKLHGKELWGFGFTQSLGFGVPGFGFKASGVGGPRELTVNRVPLHVVCLTDLCNIAGN